MATASLQRAGWEVDVLADGDVAVKRLTMPTSRPVLVLMDCDLPHLDGLEATRLIRREGSRWKSLPVVALTANAGLEDRERCMAAGMNEVLTKPFETVDLYRVLKQYAPQDAPAETPDSRPPMDGAVPDAAPALAIAVPVAASAATDLPDLPGIDIALLMQRMHGRVKSCHRLLGLFRDQYLGAEAHMRELLAVGDTETLHRFAHTLKGASSGLGAERVRHASAQLEARALDGDASSQANAVNEVIEALNEVFPGLSGL